MKIALAIGSMMGGGAERVASIISSLLAKRGHDVVLISNWRHAAYAVAPEVRRADLFRPKKWAGLTGIGDIFRLTCFLRAERPDAIITFLTSASSRMFFSSFFINTTWIVSEHSSFEKKMNFKEIFLRCILPQKADRVTVLSEVEKELAKVFFKKIRVIPNPLTLENNRVKINRDRSVCLCGDLSRYKQKGFDKMIEYWTKIQPLCPGWKLTIVGGESIPNGGRQAMEALTRKFGVEKDVVFMGRQDDMVSVFSSQAVYVSSSQTESFSMTLVEAMSQGCICISFANPGPRSIIENEKTGFLVEKGNWELLIKKICEATEITEKKRSEITKKAKLSLKRYAPIEIIRQWEELIQESVQEHTI
ncbi:MAG: glycosyltransferase [Candidatus Spyradosoma sp.]